MDSRCMQHGFRLVSTKIVVMQLCTESVRLTYCTFSWEQFWHLAFGSCDAVEAVWHAFRFAFHWLRQLCSCFSYTFSYL